MTESSEAVVASLPVQDAPQHDGPLPDAPTPDALLDVDVEPQEVPLTARSERATADRAHARGLFTELAALPEGDPRRARLRDELV